MPDIRSLCPYRLLSYDMPPATLHRGCLASPALFMFKRTALCSLYSTSLRTLEHGFGRMNGTHAFLSLCSYQMLTVFDIDICKLTSDTGKSSMTFIPWQDGTRLYRPLALPILSSPFSQRKLGFGHSAMRPFPVKRSRYAVDGNTRYCHIENITDWQLNTLIRCCIIMLLS